MSDIFSKDLSTADDAKSTRARAADWHDRRERGDWSEADQIALDAWLAASPAHVVAYLRVDAAWQRADRLSALKQSPPENAHGARRRFKFRFGSFAAGFGVLTVLGIAAAVYPWSPREQVYATAIGGHKTLTLDGGSQIELNTNTVLRVSMNGAPRKVFLDKGEAYFQIRHDASHPFVVMVAGHRVTDLGTKFAIRNETGHVRVTMVQGRVQFGGADNSVRPATLTPGDVLVATGDAVSVTRKQVAKLTAELGWRQGVLVFDSTALSDAVNEFNRYNRTKLVVADSAAARMPIDGKFRAHDVTAFTFLVQSVLGLHVTNHGDETVISR